MENHKRILVVDDDKNIANLLRTVLSRTYSVDCCYSLGDALEQYDSQEYSLVITDLLLGTDSGLTLAKYVREKDPSVEVIIITGHASMSSYKEAADLGVVSYLTKPIKIDKLKLLVKRSILSHSFNVRSKQYELESANDPSQTRTHMLDILSLYNLVSKLNQTVELQSTVRVLLRELSILHNADLVVLGVNTLGFHELYAHRGDSFFCDDEEIREILGKSENFEITTSGIEMSEILSGEIPIHFQDDRGESSEEQSIHPGKPFVIPLNSYGEDFGFIALYRESNSEIPEDRQEFYFALAPLLAPPIYRGFIERRTQAQAQTDGLTGIANRRSLQKAINRELQRTVRYNRDLAIIMMDIDDFKMVNDTYGHLMGDAVLKDITTVVNSIIRGSDFFGRYGGEEFIVILPDTAYKGAVLLAERIRQIIDEKVCDYEGDSVNYTVSVGVAIFDNENDLQLGSPVDWKSGETSLISRADEALYKAKRSGKNCVVVAE